MTDSKENYEGFQSTGRDSKCDDDSAAAAVQSQINLLRQIIKIKVRGAAVLEETQ